VITGALGVGKTTAILDLLRHRPEQQRWAVLLNEFGAVGIDGAILGAGANGYEVREVAGGCICCTAQTQLRVNLTRLLREVRPDRLLIEPTGLGHADAIIDLLRDEYLARAINLRATICLVDPAVMHNRAVLESPLFESQIQAADILVANRCDVAAQETVDAYLAFARALFPPKMLVATTSQGRLDPAWLDTDPLPHPERENCAAHDNLPSRHGRIFGPDVRFSHSALEQFFAHLSGDAQGAIERAKGVFRTGREWYLFNWARGALEKRALPYRRDSRIELIAHAGHAPDWARYDAMLQQSIRE
jgi:G3E family GTPase